MSPNFIQRTAKGNREIFSLYYTLHHGDTELMEIYFSDFFLKEI